MSSDSSFQNKTWFQTNKFTGSKARFKDFISEIKIAIKGDEATAQYGCEYLFGDWVIDPLDDKKADLPQRFKLLPVPEPLEYTIYAPGAQPTDAEYRQRGRDIARINNLNAPINKMKAHIFRAFTERLIPEIAKLFGEFSDEPHCGYIWLSKKYGTLSGGMAEMHVYSCRRID
jgi:hypothetical protein